MHSTRYKINVSRKRKGAATVEFAIALPLLLLLFAGSVDFARIFYNTQILAEGSRAIAQFGANADLSEMSEFETLLDFGRQNFEGISPTPSIQIIEGNDELLHPYIEVVVQQNFQFTNPILFNTGLLITKKSRARLFPSSESLE